MGRCRRWERRQPRNSAPPAFVGCISGLGNTAAPMQTQQEHGLLLHLARGTNANMQQLRLELAPSLERPPNLSFNLAQRRGGQGDRGTDIMGPRVRSCIEDWEKIEPVPKVPPKPVSELAGRGAPPQAEPRVPSPSVLSSGSPKPRSQLVN
jgi:hypothetical protein